MPTVHDFMLTKRLAHCLQGLWRCWLSGRKDIQPAKNWVVRYWCGYLLSVWSEVVMICIWSSWCQWHPIISCFIKI